MFTKSLSSVSKLKRWVIKSVLALTFNVFTNGSRSLLTVADGDPLSMDSGNKPHIGQQSLPRGLLPCVPLSPHSLVCTVLFAVPAAPVLSITMFSPSSTQKKTHSVAVPRMKQIGTQTETPCKEKYFWFFWIKNIPEGLNLWYMTSQRIPDWFDFLSFI